MGGRTTGRVMSERLTQALPPRTTASVARLSHRACVQHAQPAPRGGNASASVAMSAVCALTQIAPFISPAPAALFAPYFVLAADQWEIALHILNGEDPRRGTRGASGGESGTQCACEVLERCFRSRDDPRSRQGAPLRSQTLATLGFLTGSPSPSRRTRSPSWYASRTLSPNQSDLCAATAPANRWKASDGAVFSSDALQREKTNISLSRPSRTISPRGFCPSPRPLSPSHWIPRRDPPGALDDVSCGAQNLTLKFPPSPAPCRTARGTDRSKRHS